MKFEFTIDTDRIRSGNEEKVIALLLRHAADEIDAEDECELLVHDGVHVGSWAFVDRPDYRQRFDPAEAIDSRYFNLLVMLEALCKGDDALDVGGQQRTTEAIIFETFATMLSGLGSRCRSRRRCRLRAWSGRLASSRASVLATGCRT